MNERETGSMIDPSLQEELLHHMGRLDPDEQRRVVDFAHTLGDAARFGIPGRELLPFAGILDPEDAQLMLDAIEAGCERIDAG
jgi:hypothetical protein